jgi:hypothetical protein
MNTLIIVTRTDDSDEFNNLWGGEADNPLAIQTVDGLKKILLIKGSLKKHKIEDYSEILEPCVSDSKGDIGVIFHLSNSQSSVDKFYNTMGESNKQKTKFCKWYSTQLTTFWDKDNKDADKPYNRLIKAWKAEESSEADKNATFMAVWNFFMGDQKMIKLLEELDLFDPTKTYSQDELSEFKIHADKLVAHVTKKHVV